MDDLIMTKSGKHCGKRRNCSKRAISPFATIFSLLVIGYPVNYRDFLFFDKIFSKSSAVELAYKGKG